jgi:hypothetical protein
MRGRPIWSCWLSGMGRMAVPVQSTPPPAPARRRGYGAFTREQFYHQVWQEPTREVAKRYGVSDVMVVKACRALDVPNPPRGYWAKKAAGVTLPAPPPLPE